MFDEDDDNYDGDDDDRDREMLNGQSEDVSLLLLVASNWEGNFKENCLCLLITHKFIMNLTCILRFFFG